MRALQVARAGSDRPDILTRWPAKKWPAPLFSHQRACPHLLRHNILRYKQNCHDALPLGPQWGSVGAAVGFMGTMGMRGGRRGGEDAEMSR